MTNNPKSYRSKGQMNIGSLSTTDLLLALNYVENIIEKSLLLPESLADVVNKTKEIEKEVELRIFGGPLKYQSVHIEGVNPESIDLSKFDPESK